MQHHQSELLSAGIRASHLGSKCGSNAQPQHSELSKEVLIHPEAQAAVHHQNLGEDILTLRVAFRPPLLLLLLLILRLSECSNKYKVSLLLMWWAAWLTKTEECARAEKRVPDQVFMNENRAACMICCKPSMACSNTLQLGNEQCIITWMNCTLKLITLPKLCNKNPVHKSHTMGEVYHMSDSV